MTAADGEPEFSAPNRPAEPASPERAPGGPADALGRPGEPADPLGVPVKPADPLGVIAIILGCIGLVTFGFVLAIVTALVATAAGQQAVKQRRSLDNAYLGFGLAVLDAVVFLVLHYLFKLPAFAG